VGSPADGGRSNGGKARVDVDAPNDGVHPTSADGNTEPGIAPNHAAAEKAALESVSTTLLMPGEDPSSPYLEDAEHWMAVYGELHKFVVEIVGQFDAAMRDLREPAREYLRSHDMLVHEKQIQRFAERLAFWRQRTADLWAAQAGSVKSRIAAS
jgi:hypothetical protein